MPSDPADLPLTTMHVRRAVSGSAESLTWLVGRLSPLLRAQVAFRLGPALRSSYDPQDLVQEAWLTLLPKLADFSARDGRLTPVLLRFLSTTLLNKANNLVKKHLRAGRVSTGSLADVQHEVASDASGVVTAAIRAETRDAVSQCIEELPPTDREILLLRGIEQQSNTTVATVLGLTSQAVTMRYQRALGRLRDQLPGSVFDELDD